MNSILNQPVLFLGNRASIICKSFQEEIQNANSLTFSSVIPFSGLKNTIQFNERKFETACDYEFECLKNEFVSLIQSKQFSSSFKLIIGDPKSYFILTKTGEEKAAIVSKVLRQGKLL